MEVIITQGGHHIEGETAYVNVVTEMCTKKFSRYLPNQEAGTSLFPPLPSPRGFVSAVTITAASPRGFVPAVTITAASPESVSGRLYVSETAE